MTIREKLLERIEQRVLFHDEFHYMMGHGWCAQEQEEIVKDVAIEFSWWLDTSKTASDYLRKNRIDIQMDNSHVEKQKEQRKELFKLFKEEYERN